MSKDEVKFTEMKHGDKEDYELLANFEDKFIEGTADRIVRVLESLDNSLDNHYFCTLTLKFLNHLLDFLLSKKILY